MTPEIDISEFSVFADGLDHPECVAWGPDGYTYAGGEAGQVYRISSDGSYEEIGTTGGFALGITLDGTGNVYVCDMDDQQVKRMTPGGKVTGYSEGTVERPMVNPNYAVFDTEGRLYVSDSGEYRETNGCIFLIRPGGSTEVVDTRMKAFPNGMALGPDRDYLYVTCSTGPTVLRAFIRDDGTLAAPELVVDLPRCVPDGLAFDANGNLYISCYTPSRIYRLSPRGELTVFAADWEDHLLASPTNIAFCGEDLDRFVTANLARWHLTEAHLGIAGLPLLYPSF